MGKGGGGGGGGGGNRRFEEEECEKDNGQRAHKLSSDSLPPPGLAEIHRYVDVRQSLEVVCRLRHTHLRNIHY